MNERLTGTTFVIYACAVCGRAITDSRPCYASPNLTCHHGAVVYVMGEIGRLPQITYEERPPV